MSHIDCGIQVCQKTMVTEIIIIIILIIIIIIAKFVKRHTRSYRGASGGVNQAA